jgi:hypothetical protein
MTIVYLVERTRAVVEHHKIKELQTIGVSYRNPHKVASVVMKSLNAYEKDNWDDYRKPVVKIFKSPYDGVSFNSLADSIIYEGVGIKGSYIDTALLLKLSKKERMWYKFKNLFKRVK